MRLTVSTVFLFSVLLLGMVSYPSINFGDEIKSDLNSSNYLISAFAEEDDEDEKDNEDEIKNDEDETEDASKAIENAIEEIKRAEIKIIEAQNNGKETLLSEEKLKEAKELLAQAEDNFKNGNFDDAEDLAEEAEDLASESRMKYLGKSLDDETEDEVDDDKDEETEIEVEVKNDKAKVKIKINGDEYRFVITDDVSESTIIAAIIDKTGLTEDEIKTTWDFEIEDETDDDSDENELRTSEKIIKHENKAQENADQIILQLQQKIDQLEQRLQNLLDIFETGEYFGTITNADTVPDSYSIAFTGFATSLNDDSLVSDVDGDIYMESITTGSDSFKLRITGGEILIGDTFYDFVFGKARLSSSDENTTMIILGQVMDDQGNVNTIRLTLDTASALTDNFGTEPVSFDIDSSRSKIAKQWSFDATGDFASLS